MLTGSAECQRSNRIEGVAAGRDVFDISVIAGQHHCQTRKIRRFNHRPNKPRKVEHMIASEIAAPGVAYSVGDKVLVQSEVVTCRKSSQPRTGSFRGADVDFEPLFDQEPVCEVMADRAAFLQIFKPTQPDACGLGGYRCRGDEPWRVINVASRVGVRKGDRSPKRDQLLIDRVLRKGLFLSRRRVAVKMAAYQLRGVDASQDCSLSGRALRQPIDTEPRIGLSNEPIERQPRLLSLKYRKELRLKAIKRIVLATSSDADPVDEDKKNGHNVSGRADERRRRGEEVQRRRGAEAKGRRGEEGDTHRGSVKHFV